MVKSLRVARSRVSAGVPAESVAVHAVASRLVRAIGKPAIHAWRRRKARMEAHLRWHYYVRRRTWLRFLFPRPLVRSFDLTDASAVGSRRLEVGGGPYGQAGYIHVDIDPRAKHLEALAPAWRLPFPNDWAQEVLSIHALEHVAPNLLVPTLREWYRVLQPGGVVRVHVPNGPELMRAFEQSPISGKWGILGSLLGMYCGPEANRPEDLPTRADHQLVFDAPLLGWALSEAGFSEVKDVTASLEDRHTAAWHDIVRHYSLGAEATKAPRPTESS